LILMLPYQMVAQLNFGLKLQTSLEKNLNGLDPIQPQKVRKFFLSQCVICNYT